MKAEYKFKLGTDEFTLTAEVATTKDFIEQMSFYTNLPKVGPNGETDLKLTYRKVREYEYYSIVSQEAGMEFKFGQHKQGDTLYDKGWEQLYEREGGQEEEEESEERSAAPKAGSRFQKPTKQAAPEEPEEGSEEEEQQEDTPPAKAVTKKAAAPAPEAEEPEEEQAPAKPAAKPDGKMSSLMAKYGVKGSTPSTQTNLRR